MHHTEVSLIPVFNRCFGSWQIRVQRRPLASEALAAAYDRAAPGWSRLTERLGYARAYRRLFRRFLAVREDGPEDRALRVLDCGVGTGDFSLALHQVLGQSVELTAVDISSAMCDAALERFCKAGIAARVIQTDAATLPFADESFDLVISAHMLEHLCTPTPVLHECHRVLAPVVSSSRA